MAEQRKLATIMSVDIVGYSAMAETDETAALAVVARLSEALEKVAAKHQGRVFSSAGDGFMLEFESAAGALEAAEEMCAAVDRKQVRVGLHLGDVIVSEDGDLLGHGVNIAARLQKMAVPGAVVATIDVKRAVRGKLAQRLHANGVVHLNKMSETIEIFTLEAVGAPHGESIYRAEPVLAVLPFDNDSDEEEMEYFSDGVADEIIFILLRQSSLKVIGRTSAFQFRGDRKAEAAAALRASHMLDGAVRRHGEKLRVSAQLIEVDKGMALWSARYDGELSKALDLQESIAAEVGAALKLAFTRTERAPKVIDPAAYDLYLRARKNWLTLADVDEEQSEALLMRCVGLAPDFAQGWAALAAVRAFLLPRDRDTIGEPIHAAALEAAETALEIDPDCAEAIGALSLLKPAFAEHEEKIRLVDEALKRTPNDPALHVARSTWLYSVGRIREASEAVEVAARLDPLGPAVESLRASLLSARGEIEGALEIVSAAWARWPDSPFTWYMMWETLLLAGRVKEAQELTKPGAAPRRGVSDQDVRTLKAAAELWALPIEERRAGCTARLDQLATASGPLPLSTCMAAAGVGCADRAFDVIDQALDQGRALRPDPHDGFGMARAQAALQFFVNNGGVPITAHRRFAALAARLGLAQYWLATGRWPDCADEVEYDFRAACADAVAAAK